MSEKVFGSKEKSREFLLTQALLVLSTVLGIFLAAQQGFTKAVEFDYLKGDIDGWHVRTAVRAELIHNLDGMHNLIGHVRQTGSFPATAAEWPRVSRNVWDGAKYHPAYYETSPAVLAALGAFYDEVPDLLTRAQNNRVLPKVFFENLKAHLRQLESAVLPDMEAGLAAARTRLDRYDAPVPELTPPAGWTHSVPIDAS